VLGVMEHDCASRRKHAEDPGHVGVVCPSAFELPICSGLRTVGVAARTN
jgi:hypothetical protein